MTNEAVFTYVNQFTNEGMRLNLSAITDSHIFLDFNKRTDKNIIANRAPINVYWIDDSYIIAEFNIDNSDFFDF